LVVTAPTATLQQAALPAGGQVLTLSAPAGNITAGGALAAGAQPLTITAPTAVLVPLAPQVLTASSPTITMTAPSATAVLGTVDADGSASGGRRRFVVLQDFEENRQEPIELYAGWQVITLSAPPARCVFLVTPQPDAEATPRRSDDEEVIALAVLYLLVDD
jgi:hypothetical protein